MSHSYLRNFSHLVWSTKKRTPLITNSIKHRLYGYMNTLIKKERVELIAIGGMYDHIHILVKTDAQFQLCRFMGAIKSMSSKFVNSINGEEDFFAWQEGYHSCSVTPSIVQKTARYIHNQEKHHKKLLYKEEIKLLLNLDFIEDL